MSEEIKKSNNAWEDIKYLLGCWEERYFRFCKLFKKKIDPDKEVPYCEYWTVEGGYEGFKKKFGGKEHKEYCKYCDEDFTKPLIRKGVADIGDQLHWKCHHSLHIIRDRITGVIEKKNKVIYGNSFSEKELKEINELAFDEEIFRMDCYEFTGYRYVLTQQIDTEEKKKGTALMGIGTVVSIIFTIIVGLVTLGVGSWRTAEIVAPLIILMFIFFYYFLKHSIKSHEAKDAMYLCLGIDEDHPKIPSESEKHYKA